jgi:hypothetical protein
LPEPVCVEAAAPLHSVVLLLGLPLIVHRASGLAGACTAASASMRQPPLFHRMWASRNAPEACRSGTTNGSASWPDPVEPVHRHHVGACELPIDASPSTVAVSRKAIA